MDVLKAEEVDSIKDVINLVWGSAIKEDLFSRWAQGFIFSANEATALQQFEGGPCSVIAPVQAFILKNCIPHYSIEDLKQLNSAAVDGYLALSLTEILCLCASEKMQSKLKESDDKEGDSSEAKKNTNISIPVMILRVQSQEIIAPACHAWFHSNLRIKEFTNRESLLDWVKNNIDIFKSIYGILLFLYSALLSRNVTEETLANSLGGEVMESLINSSEGHGEQPVVNLLITGNPTAHLFDGVRDVGGLKMYGVESRPSIGFLHLQEYYRQLDVGWYLKNPEHPVWVCASQTHITVIFCMTRDVVCPNSEIDRAHQVFGWYDSENNGFIQRDQLKEVLTVLQLCSDDEFIKFMMSELDPDNMGLILYTKFQEAFFSGKSLHSAPDTFTAYHYNGLLSSNPQKNVQYAKAYITRQESMVSFNAQSDVTACFNTKWPRVEVQWENNFTPSLN